MYYIILGGSVRRIFKETPLFTEKIDLLGGDFLLHTIEVSILENPEAGAVISGTGGIRKLRTLDPSRQKGKRGGLRVLYLDLPHREITYLLYIYGKDEVEDITNDEKKIFKLLVSKIKGE